jgi:methionyl-tRNA formyltransferase
LKIVFIGGVKFSYDLLQYILQNNVSVSMVFSYDDSKQKFYSDFTPLDDLTKKYKIKHVKVQNINDQKNMDALQLIKPDLILVMGWSQLLKKEILSIPKMGVIGSHPTMLPKYRGRAPIPWTIIKKLKESGLTFFYMKEGADDGDILDQQKFNVSSDDDASSLYIKITNLGKSMLLKNLKLIKQGQGKRIPQDESKFIEFWPKRTSDDGKIDWSKNGKEIHTIIRANTHPYPGAFSFFRKSKLIIWKGKYVTEPSNGKGKIAKISKEGVIIGTGQGSILLQIVSLNDEKEVPANNVFFIDDINKTIK